MYPVRPVRASFGQNTQTELEEYIWNHLTSIKQANDDLHTRKVVKWRKNYKGIPREEHKSFPWENASNVVIQVIGTAVDSLKARIIASLYEVMPLFVTQIVGEWDDEEQAEEQRAAIEAAMNYFGLEPAELDLYRVESLVIDEAIKFGTSFCKCPWMHDVENQVISLDGSRQDKSYIRYSGPRPEKIPFENFLIDPKASTLDSSEFKAHIIPLSKFALEERKFRGIYNKEAIEKILPFPDRYGPSQQTASRQQGEGISVPQGFNNAEWDIYECWFPYWVNGSKYRLIVTYHYKTKTVLKQIFNFYPDNIEPFKMARLGYTDDGIYGYGFAEMLEHYQEEVTTIHNQRADNRTLANTAAMRVSRASKLDSVFSIYPGAVIPGEKDEIENLQLGNNYPSSVQEEQLALGLAEKRAGVDAGMSAPGGGTNNPRKGIYSAMGTFSVLQAGNRRSNINITDMRYFHIELGRLILKLYANFGLMGKDEIFGKQGEALRRALDSVKNGRLVLPIRAATASINKELEKQNDMMLANLAAQHYQVTAQAINMITGQQGVMLSQESKEYILKSIKAKDDLFKHIFRNFGHEDTSRLVPETGLTKSGANNGGRAEQQPTGQPAGADSITGTLGVGLPSGLGSGTGEIPGAAIR